MQLCIFSVHYCYKVWLAARMAWMDTALRGVPGGDAAGGVRDEILAEENVEGLRSQAVAVGSWSEEAGSVQSVAGGEASMGRHAVSRAR